MREREMLCEEGKKEISSQADRLKWWLLSKVELDNYLFALAP